jgi:hypothetical protein
VPTKLQGFSPSAPKDHRCSPKLIHKKLLTKRDAVSYHIEIDAGQPVTQRFGCQTRVRLGNFTVIVSSELFIVPTPQLNGFGECPTQVAITVLTFANPLAFTVG